LPPLLLLQEHFYLPLSGIDVDIDTHTPDQGTLPPPPAAAAPPAATGLSGVPASSLQQQQVSAAGLHYGQAPEGTQLSSGRAGPMGGRDRGYRGTQPTTPPAAAAAPVSMLAAAPAGAWAEGSSSPAAPHLQLKTHRPTDSSSSRAQHMQSRPTDAFMSEGLSPRVAAEARQATAVSEAPGQGGVGGAGSAAAAAAAKYVPGPLEAAGGGRWGVGRSSGRRY
jgi:hypothetical protein